MYPEEPEVPHVRGNSWTPAWRFPAWSRRTRSAGGAKVARAAWAGGGPVRAWQRRTDGDANRIAKPHTASPVRPFLGSVPTAQRMHRSLSATRKRQNELPPPATPGPGRSRALIIPPRSPRNTTASRELLDGGDTRAWDACPAGGFPRPAHGGPVCGPASRSVVKDQARRTSPPRAPPPSGSPEGAAAPAAMRWTAALTDARTLPRGRPRRPLRARIGRPSLRRALDPSSRGSTARERWIRRPCEAAPGEGAPSR